MSRFSNPLSHVRVASPCPADWDSMIGDERVRFCGQCELNVYNLSALTKTQAENLIAGTERRLCIRFYRRRDGSILTKDCPIGLRALKQRLSRIRRAVVSAVLGFVAGAGGTIGLHRLENLLIDSIVDPPGQVLGQIADSHLSLPVDRPEVGKYVTGTYAMEPPFVQGRIMPLKRRNRR